MSNPAGSPTPEDLTPGLEPEPRRHLTETQRAMRASGAGVVLGLFLWLVSRRRSA